MSNEVSVRGEPGASPLFHAPRQQHHRVLVLGGGTAGLTVAARLAREGVKGVAIVEPSRTHFYQPLWTLVGAGEARVEDTCREQATLIPRGVAWVQDWAAEVDPVARRVGTRGGLHLTYDFLVVAPGIQLDWDRVRGLREALETSDVVSSNYDVRYAPKTWEMLQRFRGGTALFTHPATPVKCAGAPQKIMYLAADLFRRRGLLEGARVVFASGGRVLFGVKAYADLLQRVVERYGIDTRYQHSLVEVRAARREAVFEVTREEGTTEEVIPYALLHVCPPQSAPDFLKQSPLAHREGPSRGWVKAHKHTLQHPDYPDVFALGDAADLPTSRTGAAVRAQAPVLVENLLAVMAGRAPTAHYDGYASCPLTTGYGRLLLAEFDYDGKPTPTLPLIDTLQERRDMWLLKKYGLPTLYWRFMLRGRA